MSKIIVAIDSFKGCLTSAEANQAAVEGILQRHSWANYLMVFSSERNNIMFLSHSLPVVSMITNITNIAIVLAIFFSFQTRLIDFQTRFKGFQK